MPTPASSSPSSCELEASAVPTLATLPTGRAFWLKFTLGALLLLALTGVLAFFFRAPLQEGANWFMAQFGLWGLVAGVLITDSWAIPPMSHEGFLFAAYAAGTSYIKIVLIAGSASVCAGFLGYAYGMLLGKSKRVLHFLHKTGLQYIIEKRPFTVVAMAAFFPIPFSPTTWTAGMVRIPLLPFVLGCSVRYLKVAFYLGIIVLGWGQA